MGAEVPDDASVGLVQAKVHAARGDEVDLAQLAGVDQGAHGPDRRAIEERVPRHQHEPFELGDLGQLVALRRGRGKRLLHKHMLPRVQSGGGDPMVGRNGGRNRDCFDLRVVEERLDRLIAARRRVAPADPVQPLVREIAKRGQARVWALLKVAGEVRPPIAESYDRDRDRLELEVAAGGEQAAPAVVVRAAVSVRGAHAVPPSRSSSTGVRNKSLTSRPSDQSRT